MWPLSLFFPSESLALSKHCIRNPSLQYSTFQQTTGKKYIFTYAIYEKGGVAEPQRNPQPNKYVNKFKK